MKEIIVPDNGTREHILLSEVYGSLPLAGCVVVRDELAGKNVMGDVDSSIVPEIAYVAPAGKAFEMTGAFTLDSDQNDITIWGPPQYSTEKILQTTESDRYAHLLKLAKDDKRKVICFLQDPEGHYDEEITDYEPEFEPLERFIGRTLAIRITNGWPMITVKGEVASWTETPLQVVEIPVASGSQYTEGYVAEVPQAFTFWQRGTAYGAYGKCTVALCDYSPIEQSIKPELKNSRLGLDKLWAPDEPTALEAAQVKADYYLMELTEEEMTQFARSIMEERRLRRYPGERPVADDPLRNFIIAQDASAYTGESAREIIVPKSHALPHVIVAATMREALTETVPAQRDKHTRF